MSPELTDLLYTCDCAPFLGMAYRVSIAAVNAYGPSLYATREAEESCDITVDEPLSAPSSPITSAAEKGEVEGEGEAEGEESHFAVVYTLPLLASFVRRCWRKLGAAGLPRRVTTISWTSADKAFESTRPAGPGPKLRDVPWPSLASARRLHPPLLARTAAVLAQCLAKPVKGSVKPSEPSRAGHPALEAFPLDHLVAFLLPAFGHSLLRGGGSEEGSGNPSDGGPPHARPGAKPSKSDARPSKAVERSGALELTLALAGQVAATAWHGASSQEEPRDAGVAQWAVTVAAEAVQFFWLLATRMDLAHRAPHARAAESHVATPRRQASLELQPVPSAGRGGGLSKSLGVAKRPSTGGRGADAEASGPENAVFRLLARVSQPVSNRETCSEPETPVQSAPTATAAPNADSDATALTTGAATAVGTATAVCAAADPSGHAAVNVEAAEFTLAIDELASETAIAMQELAIADLNTSSVGGAGFRELRGEEREVSFQGFLGGLIVGADDAFPSEGPGLAPNAPSSRHSGPRGADAHAEFLADADLSAAMAELAVEACQALEYIQLTPS